MSILNGKKHYKEFKARQDTHGSFNLGISECGVCGALRGDLFMRNAEKKIPPEKRPKVMRALGRMYRGWKEMMDSSGAKEEEVKIREETTTEMADLSGGAWSIDDAKKKMTTKSDRG
jgi:Sec-independent protein translocase protein TatA